MRILRLLRRVSRIYCRDLLYISVVRAASLQSLENGREMRSQAGVGANASDQIKLQSMHAIKRASKQAALTTGSRICGLCTGHCIMEAS